MRSVSVDYGGTGLRIIERDPPASPGAGQVLFRILLLGVCGTDRELAFGHLGEPPPGETMLVIGHEALGEVIACGPGVRGFATGDLVVPTVRRACPAKCPSCAAGRRDLCVTLRYSERGIFREHGYFTEYAVDDATDLIRAPREAGGDAVLLEPLSIVEKAIARGTSLLQGTGNRALVLGLGPIGILAACALAIRGYAVTVHSAETEDHPHTRLLRSMHIAYSAAFPTAAADLIIEAAGSGDLALAALNLLAPCGAMVVVGAQNVVGTVPFLDLLVKNQTVAGVVNSSRADFERAASDLVRIPAQVRTGMVERFHFNDFQKTLAARRSLAPKAVHVIAE